jgi:hypothetical protein
MSDNTSHPRPPVAGDAAQLRSFVRSDGKGEGDDRVKLIFEAQESGFVEIHLEGADRLRDVARKTGKSEEALRDGAEWLAVNRACQDGVMVVECVTAGGGAFDHVVGMACDRYEVELRDEELLPANERDLLAAVVRIANLHQSPDSTFWQLLHSAPDRTEEMMGAGEGPDE